MTSIARRAKRALSKTALARSSDDGFSKFAIVAEQYDPATVEANLAAADPWIAEPTPSLTQQTRNSELGQQRNVESWHSVPRAKWDLP
jgi:hypothetical protein